MNNAKYGFLPWLRLGITGHLDQIDTLSVAGTGSLPERARVNAVLGTTLGVTSGNISKELQLVGPGDIIAIDKKVVLRTEPENGTFTFEANYLPSIEFYEEDFPWRYTPAKASPTTKQLRPWLALVVLKDEEYKLCPPKGDGLPAVLEINISALGSLNDILHPSEEHWAWAHVQVNKPNPGSSGNPPQMPDYIRNLETDLAKDPDVAFSRLLSSRRLEPGISYTAFLIPAFETGRLAGLGKDTTATPSLQASWDVNASTSGDALLFPVYYQWRFGTSASGDFESMVDALIPNATLPALGGTTVNIDRSGVAYLDDVFKHSPPPNIQRTIEMEAALCPPGFNPGSGLNATPPTNYTARLQEILNLADYAKSNSFAPQANPFVLSKGFKPVGSASLPVGIAEDDPVVVPPLYGQWHANQSKVDTSSPAWFQKANLDPRYRIAAGLGARVVRENQNNFLEVAWKQIGEVLTVNDKINKAIAAQKVSEAIFDKHIIGDIDIPGLLPSASAKLDTLIRTATPSLGNIRIGGNNPNGSNAAGNSGVANTETIPRAALRATLTETATTPQFRKATRSKASYVKKIGPNTTNNLVGQIHDEHVVTANPLTQPAEVIPATTLLDNSNYNNDQSIQYHNNNTGNYMAAYSPPSVIAQLVYQDSFTQLLGTVKGYGARQTAYANETGGKQLDAGSLVTNIVSSLNPAINIPQRTWDAIGAQSNMLPLHPVMAYPVIDEAMCNYLSALSTEYVLPHLDKYPNNTVTVLQPNKNFIEAYMLGLNHEFAKELLWQEYPTDQRGSYFRQFWDIADTVMPPGQNASEYFYDVKPLHSWSGDLGNNQNTRLSGGSGYLMLVVRGELLKKFPNTLIYMQKAVGAAPTTANDAPRLLAGNPVNSAGNFDPAVIKFPVMKAYIQPDIAIIGFSINKPTAMGSGTAADPGWFFVFQERPGQLRFGLDEAGAFIPSLRKWDDLNWSHMNSGNNGIVYKVARMNGVPNVAAFNSAPIPSNPTGLPNNEGKQWGSNAADNAWILLQKPVKMAVHADDLIA